MWAWWSAPATISLALAEEIAAPLWQAVQVAEAEGQPASLLYLNVPVWIAPKEATYLVGTEGLTFIPAEESPNGMPLLAVGNEVSGTTTIFAIVEK